MSSRVAFEDTIPLEFYEICDLVRRERERIGPHEFSLSLASKALKGSAIIEDAERALIREPMENPTLRPLRRLIEVEIRGRALRGQDARATWYAQHRGFRCPFGSEGYTLARRHKHPLASSLELPRLLQQMNNETKSVYSLDRPLAVRLKFWRDDKRRFPSSWKIQRQYRLRESKPTIPGTPSDRRKTK
jgi:hypothetical protein